ncbi:MAG: hypothetical protein RLY43_304 [Bacteroidota bacterium]|jgi:FkbM family methyltransferase
MSLNKILFNIKKLMFRLYPRYKTFSTYLFGKKFFIPDKSSFMFMYEEIFEKEIYKFDTQKQNPLIIDAGANIGLSTLYFKKLFKNAKVISFEPDPYIFNFLEKNIINQKLSDITLINKGLSNKEDTTNFYSEKSDGGRIAQKEDKDSIIQVQLTKLSPFLNEEVDFLKIDIEGSEIEVLKECKDNLKNVKNIFVEFHSLTSKEQELDSLLQILKENGFRYYIENVGIHSDFPFLKINQYSGYDLQLNIWGYRNI